MTFNELFFTEQMFLKNAKSVLDNDALVEDTDSYISEVAMGVISCAFALEALINSLYRESGKLHSYERIEIRSKIEILGYIANVSVDYGQMPWQGIAELIRVRNWLVHFKDPYIGLIGSDGQYICDQNHSIPKIQPKGVFNKAKLKKYYRSVLCGGKQFAEALNLRDYFTFLFDESYSFYELG